VPEDDLERAFHEGRLTRRAFVRQLVDQGVDMPDALARAEAIVPSPAPAAAVREAVEVSALSSERPRQVDELEVNFVGDGYVVYDRGQRRMHSLNNTAALVFELCTGENDERDIARLLQRAYDLEAAPDAEVRECLASLAKEQLIT
jgi:hypothetical protein